MIGEQRDKRLTASDGFGRRASFRSDRSKRPIAALVKLGRERPGTDALDHIGT